LYGPDTADFDDALGVGERAGIEDESAVPVAEDDAGVPVLRELHERILHRTGS